MRRLRRPWWTWRDPVVRRLVRSSRRLRQACRAAEANPSVASLQRAADLCDELSSIPELWEHTDGV